MQDPEPDPTGVEAGTVADALLAVARAAAGRKAAGVTAAPARSSRRATRRPAEVVQQRRARAASVPPGARSRTAPPAGDRCAAPASRAGRCPAARRRDRRRRRCSAGAAGRPAATAPAGRRPGRCLTPPNRSSMPAALPEGRAARSEKSSSAPRPGMATPGPRGRRREQVGERDRHPRASRCPAPAAKGSGSEATGETAPPVRTRAALGRRRGSGRQPGQQIGKRIVFGRHRARPPPRQSRRAGSATAAPVRPRVRSCRP